MYSDTDIIAAVKRGDITITDFNDGMGPNDPLGTNSYDLRLDGLYLLDVVWHNDEPWYVRRSAVGCDHHVIIPVCGTLLARTIERVATFGNIAAEMKARSSVGKMGAAVCKCAGLGDVGFDNHWVVELTAFVDQGQHSMISGERIAQIVFFETKSPPRNPYSGQYRIEDWPACMVPKEWRHHIVDDLAEIGATA